MDRTAWIAVALCVVGLVLWELYLAKQAPPRRAPVPAAPHQISPGPTGAASGSTSPIVAAPAIPSKAVETAPSFPEKIETLRNSDVELRLTNRGGGIKEAVLLKQVAEKGQRVVLNSAECAPIGSIIEQPSAPALPEFIASPQSNLAVQFERTTSEQIKIRKKFFFEKSPEEKDNFVIEMDVDVENHGPNPYQTAGYFVALGSGASTLSARVTKNYSELKVRWVCPAFNYSRGKPTTRVLRSTPVQNFTTGLRNSRTMKLRSWISGCSKSCVSFSSIS